MGVCLGKTEEDSIPMGEPVDPTPLKNSRALIIFVIGGPGVGKITLCKRLTVKYGMILIWVSNMLREEIATHSERGRRFKTYMEKGKIIPAKVIVHLVVQKMLAHPNAMGYVVVGFPRDRKQATLFNSEVRPPALLINLYARRVILQERLTKRAMAVARFDDTTEAVCNRVINYYVNVKGAIAPNKAVAKTIDAEGSAEKVYLEACGLIEDVLAKESG